VFSDPVNFIDPNGKWSITISRYLGFGGSLTFGVGKDGKFFASVKIGIGFGVGLIVDPNGEFHNSLDTSKETNVFWAGYSEYGAGVYGNAIGEENVEGTRLIIDKLTGERSLEHFELNSFLENNPATWGATCSASTGISLGFKAK